MKISQWIHLILALFLFGALLQCFKEDTRATVHCTVSKDGNRIQYEVHGQGDTALVFVHGWSCDRSYWKYQTAEFSKKYKVILLDLAGHGDSEMKREAWTMKHFGEDVVSVTEQEDVKQTILIGHSMGGIVILEAAHLLKDKPVALIGVDTYHDVGAIPDEAAVDQMIKPLTENFSENLDDLMKPWLFSTTSDSTLVRTILQDMASSPPHISLKALRNLWTYKQEAELMKKINVPVYCINSDMYPVNRQAGRAHAPVFNVRIIKNTGHFPMLEVPDQFNKQLWEVLQLAG